MDLQLKGKKAVVTGGSRGIGLAIAELLADEGCDVAVCARGQDGVDAAVKALEETIGCPLGVKLLIEGEEEMGSPHLEGLVAANTDRLACDLTITADGPYHTDGNPLIIFGVRGLLFMDVAIDGAPHDLHSGSNGGIAPAPARQLVGALAAMWNEDGSVAIPGFYEDIVAPTSTERRLAAQLPNPQRARPDDAAGPSSTAPWHRLMFEPTSTSPVSPAVTMERASRR